MENNDFFIDQLVRGCQNFYVRDSASDVEIFKLEMNNQQYHSLHEFLQIFINGGVLQKALDSHIECGEFFLRTKDMEVSVIAILRKVGCNRRVIFFIDLPDNLKGIENLEKKNRFLKTRLDFFQTLLDSSPFLLYAKSEHCEVYNKEYLNWKEMITFPSKSCTFSADIGVRSLLIEAKVNDTMLALFGQDNVSFSKSNDALALYEKRIEVLLKNTSEKIAILDHNMQRIACSRVFLKDKSLEKAIKKQIPELRRMITPKIIKLELSERTVNIEVIPYLKETILIFR